MVSRWKWRRRGCSPCAFSTSAITWKASCSWITSRTSSATASARNWRNSTGSGPEGHTRVSPSHPQPETLRLGFAGTPDFAARILQGLLDGGRTPAVVYTQPDRPTGRGRRVQPSPVKRLAEAHTLPLCQPTSLKGDAAAHDLAAWNLDVLVVAAYGLILPPSI